MISYRENTEAKLKFTTYPHARIVTYTIPVIASIFALYWSLYYSPIESSLICQKIVSDRVNCIIKEKSILNPFPTRIEIQDLQKAPKLGISRGQITLEANYNPKFFNLIKNPQRYRFPTKAKTLLEYSNFNLRAPFKIFNQVDRINQFITGKLELKYLKIEQSFNLVTFTLFALPIIAIPLVILFRVFQWLRNSSFYTVFEFSKSDRILTIIENKLFKFNYKNVYSLDKIQGLRVNKNVVNNDVAKANILLTFKDRDEYLVDEFSNIDSAEEHCELVNNFIQQCKYQ